MSDQMSRRRLLKLTGAAVTLSLLPEAPLVQADQPAAQPASVAQRYRIGVCDWMLLKRQKLGAFKWARQCDMDGVEVDMGGLGNRETFDNQLRDPAIRQQFLDTARESNLEICSLAMSAFYAQSFAERDKVDALMEDCIATMQQMGVLVAFLPLGVRSDLKAKPELRPAVVHRLKAFAAKAEKAGVIIGVETALDAEGDKKLLDDIGSRAIQIYFNFSNAIQNGRDLCVELRTLGKDRICQVHCTNQDGRWLQDDPKIDMPKVKQTLDDMGWNGWLVIERSRMPGKSVEENFSANARYLKSVFQSG